ncbi:YwdI family protein [Cytobacillus sp. FJAT-54145]|uniref:YwdI family protein n=1 Tax=Cytobacillus spartinae TaxID=3299023 RepID=A0ABW6KCD1_9BACI
MSIPVRKLLEKMEQEMTQAKRSESSAHIRERVHAIKTLCELVLDEQVKMEGTLKVATSTSITQGQPVSVQQQTKRMEIDDQSNGESLFDF